MAQISLTEEQKKITDTLLDWKKGNKPYITLGGYAGTGKTTLVSHFRKELEKQHKGIAVAFCSYTGKAARVLEGKLKETGAIYPKDSVSTIHSLIYSPMVDDKDEIIGWELREDIEADLIIVDEASMVDQSIWKDLTSYMIPIIAVGDHGQLPPIKGSFNLMQSPILKLNEIHRQARENPIIALSIEAREKGQIAAGKYSPVVQKISRQEDDVRDQIEDWLAMYNDETLVLCGYNNTRIRLNSHIRGFLGFDSSLPQPGDRVICLRNSHKERIYNGMLGTMSHLEDESADFYYAEIQMDGEEDQFKGLVSVEQFNSPQTLNYTEKRYLFNRCELFDFGYALTVHKAQGSQSRRVILFEERFRSMSDDEWSRWLYTAVTRAEEELYIVG
ncbi:MAG: AAA family ATPase [Candidatus Dojkabacteria bacterium]|nr:MAG: AAA family ATPase [Candidatus Dojkabacteria bacterium]